MNCVAVCPKGLNPHELLGYQEYANFPGYLRKRLAELMPGASVKAG